MEEKGRRNLYRGRGSTPLEKLKNERRHGEGGSASRCSHAFLKKEILQFTMKVNCSISTCRSPRASGSLSPVFIHFTSPSSYLSQKLQQVLAQLQASGNHPLPLKTRRTGPTKPKYSIPPTEWPIVQRRVVENQEPLRRVADDYGVSYETVRRTVAVARKQSQAR